MSDTNLKELMVIHHSLIGAIYFRDDDVNRPFDRYWIRLNAIGLNVRPRGKVYLRLREQQLECTTKMIELEAIALAAEFEQSAEDLGNE